MSQPLISADALHELRASGRPLQILDASFELSDPAAGARAHREGRIPGSIHVDLDHELSRPKTGSNGRHPLPDAATTQAWLARLGLHPDVTTIVWDRAQGMTAGRAWWMLRRAGFADVRVLDGGWQAWVESGGETVAGEPPPPKALEAVGQHAVSNPGGAAAAAPDGFGSVDHAALRREVDAGRVGPQAGTAILLVDARAADRFRGENETLDPVGGHIPGAVNRPFRANLDAATGRFKAPEQLRREWLDLLGGRDPGGVVVTCGSGVSACHHLLAMHAAGLEGARLYPGSWSEWCAQPGAPVATGP